MDKDTLARWTFKTLAAMVERTYFLVEDGWRREIPDLCSFMGSGEDRKSYVIEAMKENIVIGYPERPGDEELGFIREACSVYVESLFTEHDPSDRLRAVETFCLSKYFSV